MSPWIDNNGLLDPRKDHILWQQSFHTRHKLTTHQSTIDTEMSNVPTKKAVVWISPLVASDYIQNWTKTIRTKLSGFP